MEKKAPEGLLYHIIPEIFPVTTTIFTEMSFFCHRIGVTFVKTAGIMIEYNPMHTGHLRLVEQIRARLGPETAVIGVMSGDFVQRGDFALVRRQARARAAVESGVSLVLELPLPWAAAPAERFAGGGIEMLAATGVVSHLAFGSECGEAGPLMRAAACLETEAYRCALRRRLTSGASFAACRQDAVAEVLGPEEASVLAYPNNNLGVEYCRALLRQGAGIRPLTVLRTGEAHDSVFTAGEHPAASAIRALVRAGERERALALMTPAMASAYRREEAAGRAPVLAESCERAVLARLRSMREEDFAALDQGREGLYRRLYRASRQAPSVAAVLEDAKVKRYAYARLRRMVLWAYLGILPAALPEHVPYLRVLAADAAGRTLLARMRKTASLPVLTKPGHVRRLGADAQALFALESRGADLYALAYPDLAAAAGGALWKEGPVML